MSNATEWSRAVCTNPSEAAKVKLNLTVQNIGTCSAQDIAITMNVKLGDTAIATLTHPTPPGTIGGLTAGEPYGWVSDWMTLTIDELRALRCGAPISIQITDISGDVLYKEGGIYKSAGSWKNYFDAANATAAHLFLDLGDGTTTEQLVYAGVKDWEPVVTLKDALIWAANGQETAQGPTVQFYQPGGSLGDAALLDDWYFSLDQGTYDEISSYLVNPDFNLFDTVLTPGSVIVAKAPPINPTPDIHWAVLSPRDGTVTAYVDDYFFTQNKIDVWFVDKYGNMNEMAWDDTKLYFVCTCPANADGSTYFKDGTEKIVAQNAMYENLSDSNRTEMPVSEMQYLWSFDNIYPTMNFCNTPGYAKNVFVSGEYAYVADYYSGLQVIDISDPENPSIAGACDTPGYAQDVVVSGGFAYVADGGSGLQVINISDPENLSIAGACDTPQNAGAVVVSGGFAYVADGGSGLQVIDISIPGSPSIEGACDTPGYAYDVVVSGGFAYVADGGSGLQVINISNSGSPLIAYTCDTPGYAEGVFVSGKYAYVADRDSGLQVIDINFNDFFNPHDPFIAGSCDTPGYAEGVFFSGGYAYVADRDSVQVIAINEIGGAVFPAIVGALPLTSSGIYVKDNLAYVADDYGLLIVDVADPSNPTFPGYSSYIITEGLGYSVFVSGSHAYVGGGETKGFKISDVSDPYDPILTGSCDLEFDADCMFDTDVFVRDNFAYVADQPHGLRIINISNPANPVLSGSLDLPQDASGIFVSGEYAYVADGSPGLQVIDISDPENLSIEDLYTCDTPGFAQDVFVSGEYAYVADDYSGLQVIDISDPENPSIAGACDTPGYAQDVVVSGGFAYVADGGSGLQVINISDPENLSIAGACDTSAYAVAVSGGYAYVLPYYFTNDPAIQVLDVTDPSKPTMAASIDILRPARDLFVKDNVIYLTGDELDLSVLIFY